MCLFMTPVGFPTAELWAFVNSSDSRLTGASPLFAIFPALFFIETVLNASGTLVGVLGLAGGALLPGKGLGASLGRSTAASD